MKRGYNMNFTLLIIWAQMLFGTLACSKDQSNKEMHKSQTVVNEKPITVGAEQLDVYAPLLVNKKVGLVVNQTSMVADVHLVDLLLRKGIQVTTVFAPEHGFRGGADAGEHVENLTDKSTGLPIISLYGSNKKPNAAQLANLDVVVFDIQDVGARFYTYISTMHYVMEACAENNIPVIILDRPNPNGNYVDGPVLDLKYKSFVGMHPVPIVHGMTVGEYAQMINGQGWLKAGIKADLTVIPCKNYDHNRSYTLPVKPSPNLPNQRSIMLYPSLCLFEGTTVSVGRGTNMQFQIYGHPSLPNSAFHFIPKPGPGSKHPKHNGKICFGKSFESLNPDDLFLQRKLDLSHLITTYNAFKILEEVTGNEEIFFLENNFFDKLAGSDQLRKMIIAGNSEEEIKASWQNELEKFKSVREKYLIY